MTTTILLVEDRQGVPVGIRFSSLEAAREWEDRHELEVTCVGAVRLISQAEAQRDLLP